MIFVTGTCTSWTAYGVLQSVLWTLLHLLHFCVANQLVSIVEDQHNKPWRPLPSGMIRPQHASALRWALILPCVLHSRNCNALLPSNVIILSTFIYNDLGLHYHWAAKNILTAIGYMAFNYGALSCLGEFECLISSLGLTSHR